MPADNIRYDLLSEDALRGVIRTVLTNAAAKGLPGDNIFFITFDTRAEGVRMSPRLKASYPEEMTIILQHQFWDLAVSDDRFEVGLSFGGIPERLVVPFSAIKSFLDPSVKFGLQFDTSDVAETEDAALPAAPAPSAVSVPAAAAKTLEKNSETEDEPASPGEGPGQGGERDERQQPPGVDVGRVGKQRGQAEARHDEGGDVPVVADDEVVPERAECLELLHQATTSDSLAGAAAAILRERSQKM